MFSLARRAKVVKALILHKLDTIISQLEAVDRVSNFSKDVIPHKLDTIVSRLEAVEGSINSSLENETSLLQASIYLVEALQQQNQNHQEQQHQTLQQFATLQQQSQNHQEQQHQTLQQFATLQQQSQNHQEQQHQTLQQLAALQQQSQNHQEQQHQTLQQLAALQQQSQNHQEQQHQTLQQSQNHQEQQHQTLQQLAALQQQSQNHQEQQHQTLQQSQNHQEQQHQTLQQLAALQQQSQNHQEQQHQTLQQLAAFQKQRRVIVTTEDYLLLNPEVSLMTYLYSYLPSRNALDIGANVGEVSEHLLQSGYEVYSFEPFPPVFDKLRDRLSNNRNFHPYRLALGSTDGTMDLHIATDISGSDKYKDSTLFNSLTPHSMPDDLKFKSTIRVPVRSLESLHNSLEVPYNIGFVKIDTEGFDLEVIRGMSEYRYPVVMTEFWDSKIAFGKSGAFNKLEELVKEMKKRDYHWHIVIYRVWGESNGTAFYCNYSHSVDNSWGNVFFFQNYNIFTQAVKWCSTVLPATYFNG